MRRTNNVEEPSWVGTYWKLKDKRKEKKKGGSEQNAMNDKKAEDLLRYD